MVAPTVHKKRFSPFQLSTGALLCLCPALYLLSKAMGFPWLWALAPLLFYIPALVLGSIFIRLDFYVKSWHGVTPDPVKGTAPEVALTFDDGPCELTGPVLDILDLYGAKATFFLIGKHVSGNEALLQRMVREGHGIGTHSYGHSWRFDFYGRKRMTDDMLMARTAVKSATGKEPMLFRPPYGVTTPVMARAMKRLGWTSVGWNVRSFDTVARDADRLFEKLVRDVRPGSIVLLHDTCPITLSVLPRFLAFLAAQGYRCVALGDK